MLRLCLGVASLRCTGLRLPQGRVNVNCSGILFCQTLNNNIMKNKVIIAVCLLLTIGAKAQMTFQTSYPSNFVQVINLQLSGKKYYVLDYTAGQARLYNLNHSLWKTINFPTITGYTFGFGESTWYASENLFKIDNKVDLAISYHLTTGGTYRVVVIDETGAIINTVDSVRTVTVYNTSATGADTFVAVFSNYGTDLTKVYSLPGTLPCSMCSNGLGLAKVEPKSLLSDPVPNPSTTQVKLTFELPEDAKQGQIDIFTSTGKLVKSYTVDRTFGYITLDNSELPSGLYYYNLTANGTITSVKKMVVLK